MSTRIRSTSWRAAVLAALLLYPLYAAAQSSNIDGSKVLTNGYLIIRDSYLRVGTGSTPDVTPGQDDVFIEGTLEVDGAVRFDGGQSFGGAIASTVVNAAGGSANPIDWTGTLGIMNGSDTFEVLDLNFTNANHTGASNVVRGIDISGITGDAEATETAVNIGSGWDVGLASASPVTITATASVGSCTLDGASPSVCTATVTAASTCTCSPVGATAAIAAAGCAVGLSGTTLTVTSANGATNVVNYHCF